MNKLYLLSALAVASFSAIADRDIAAAEALVTDKALVDSSHRIGATSIRYLSYAASTMTATDSNKHFSYSSGGCMQASSLGTYLTHKVDLPSGSKIVSISANGKDTGSNRAFNFSFSRHIRDTAGAGTSIDLLSTNNIPHSSGIAATPGRISLGGFFNPPITVYNSSALVLKMTPGRDNKTEVCSIRIGYIPPDIAADVIFASDFYR